FSVTHHILPKMPWPIDMDFAPAQLHFKDNIVSQDWKPQQQWSYPESEGYCSLSPASSTDSYNNHTGQSQMEMQQKRSKPFPPKRSQKKRGVCIQRESASEREKMRMRNLSTALQNVRRYLPPAVAPVGKNLTKIETLRLTIRYIAHLSECTSLQSITA
uniref:BHLH domain-containing protein n=1 Tax=Leptobrachium leishanense TaxID=445787 RepID=A0A8C5M8L0_9ANUR